MFLVAIFESKGSEPIIQGILSLNSIILPTSAGFILGLFTELSSFGWSGLIFSKSAKVLSYTTWRSPIMPIDIFNIKIRKEAEFFCSLQIASNENGLKVFRLTSLFANPR